ncbi:MAG: GDSL-type esterase/lipase family protein [Porticoccaceae bacterium]|nr:GDSL-type esterase/lipase family protein [Porticoccaceae bacterium]
MRLMPWFCIFLLSACGGGSNSPVEIAENEIPTAPLAEIPRVEAKTVTQTVDGQIEDRSYLISYPENPTQDSYPVVFFFHGAGGNGQDLLNSNPQLSGLIDAGEFIGIFPDGFEQRWNVNNETNADDLDFVSLIINNLPSEGLFNLNRIYGVGVSNGAGIVNKIAKEMAIFKGIAPLVSQQTVAIGNTVPSQAVSVFQLNTTGDDLVPVNGGIGVADTDFMSAQASAENWASNFNCTMGPSKRTLMWGDYAVEEYTFSGCIENKKVRYFLVADAGHTLSFGDNVNLYDLIWTFFKSTDRPSAVNAKLLALGDSYTIGQSVCSSCSFPEQLKDSLKFEFSDRDTFELQIIAETGWTTTDLKDAIIAENPSNDFDLVTLLIGVNNQVQDKPFNLYETEFVALVDSAISFAGGDATKLIVVSIPDYAYTSFGSSFNPAKISAELDLYNNFAQQYCEENDLSYVGITDITRQGLENTALVAYDRLHPSELAYSLFVERILPLALEKLE